MASVTIENLPDDLLDELRAAAEHDRRSLDEQIIHLLETALRGRAATASAPDVVAQVEAWRKLAGKWESDTDAATEAARIAAPRSRPRSKRPS